MYIAVATEPSTPAGRLRSPRRAAVLGLTAAAALAFAGVGTGTASAALPSECTQSGQTVTCTYGYTGAEQTFLVPAGVTSVEVSAAGASGGRGFYGPSDAMLQGPGGRGASVTGVVDGLASGSTLYVEAGGIGRDGVGGDGSAGTSAFNGGGGSGGAFSFNRAGGGGGASDVRTVPRDSAGSLSSRRLVAGGGGGGGGNVGNTTAPAAGGDAGQPGRNDTGDGTARGGGAGTATAGGTGGTHPSGNNGQSGTDGTGGLGGALLGGGGGGGLYGGGGGAGAGYADGAGGGGGSSLVPGGGTQLLADPMQAGSVTIRYAVPPPAATVRVTGSGTLSSVSGEPTTFSLDVSATGSNATGTCTLRGQTSGNTITCTGVYDVRRSGNQVTFRGTGLYNGRQPISFTATAVDGNPDSYTIFGAGQRYGGTVTSGDITVS